MKTLLIGQVPDEESRSPCPRRRGPDGRIHAERTDVKYIDGSNKAGSGMMDDQMADESVFVAARGQGW